MTKPTATSLKSTSDAKTRLVDAKGLSINGDLHQIVGRLGVIESRLITDLRPSGKGLRKLADKKIAKLAASMRSFEIIMPILISPDGEVIAGEARLEAAKQLGMAQVPCLVAAHLSAAGARLPHCRQQAGGRRLGSARAGARA